MKDNVAYIKNKLKDNMIMFGKVIMPNMFSVPSPEFHYKIADAIVDDSNKQINIIAPRGHAKSSIVGGVYPLFHICLLYTSPSPRDRQKSRMPSSA